MGNSPRKQFSTTTQSTLDVQKYSGQWYITRDTSEERSCDLVVAYYFPMDDVLNMTTYCYTNKTLSHLTQSTAIVPNKYEPSKLVVRTQGSYGITKYWVYYTDYTTYAIVGFGEANRANTGSDFMVLSRKSSLSESIASEVKSKLSEYGLVSIPY